MKKVKQTILNLSLKTKWILTVGATIFISYAIISIVLFIALQTWLLHNEEKNAMRTVDDITSFFESQSSAVTIQQLQNNTALMKAILNQEQTVRIFNFDGVEVIRINDVMHAAPLPQMTGDYFSPIIKQQKVETTDAFVVHKIVQIGPFQGMMQMIHPLTTFHAMLKYILTTIIIVGLGALLFSVSISYYLANFLIKPLVQLRDAMIDVRKRGFSAQPPFNYRADDEIGDLLTMYRSMMNELEISFTRQQQFVADASHELRTPIQVIEGHLSLIKRWGKDDPEVLAEALDTSLEEIVRMKKMIEELLQLARREEVDGHAIADVELVLKNVERELVQLYPNVQFEYDVIGQKELASITEQAAGQIFRNIISNGIRYNEQEPTIQLSIQYTKLAIIVTISDNGIGISEKHLPFIFDRFYRVDEARTNHIGGTGLGLSILKMLAEKYRIEINVKSSVDKGTSFILNFPLN
ncbi:HAMP domain-containing sensor histidine kinase [Solibacillus sp. FSL K6-1523]|uniref:HAMP domain-containing sensor histidine kinase n=1 Tax=Solibacillus sp. FSL K6-1523 TaxID=2921471 RepID=UPI0030F8F815